jgi:uncharacterized protein YgbK (DUF1537 family)
VILGLIADDLTGAADASVQFARRGWETFLALDVRLKPDPTYREVRLKLDTTYGVIALTTDSRALTNAAAEDLTARAVGRANELGVDRLFLKIDSTMRGSVPGQIAGALAGWRVSHPEARALVCPAYPTMGRTVEACRLLVHGEPVERTAIGRDPVTPVKTSDMRALVPESPHVSIADAASDEDLAALAAAISAEGPSMIAVGSGGLAEALAEIWSSGEVRSVRLQPDRDLSRPDRNPRILILVTSLNPVSHAQIARLQRTFPDVDVLLPPSERVVGGSVADALAAKLGELVSRERWDVLGMIGGDGARAALKHLRASGIRIAGSLVEGVPFGMIAGGDADGMAIFTKAGGFGAEDALVRAIERLRA